MFDNIMEAIPTERESFVFKSKDPFSPDSIGKNKHFDRRSCPISRLLTELICRTNSQVFVSISHLNTKKCKPFCSETQELHPQLDTSRLYDQNTVQGELKKV